MKSLNICCNQWPIIKMVNIYCYGLLVSKRKRSLLLQDFAQPLHGYTHGIFWINRCYTRGAVQCQSTNYLNWQRSLVPFTCVEWTALAVYLFPRTTENHFLTHSSEENATGRWCVLKKTKHLDTEGQGSHSEHINSFLCVWFQSIKHDAYLQTSPSTSSCMIQRQLFLHGYCLTHLSY